MVCIVLCRWRASSLPDESKYFCAIGWAKTSVKVMYLIGIPSVFWDFSSSYHGVKRQAMRESRWERLHGKNKPIVLK
ncbi:hypothetical protein BJQ97_02604 [Geobacillus sp. TFV-3]|nr:hypothetical protein BJQ97_02604 [Geobacillus sp. TFV-3]